MGAFLLGVFALLAVVADPGAQPAGEDYPAQAERWEAIASRLVALVDELITTDELWDVVSLPQNRAEWANRLSVLSDAAPKPQPPDEPYYLLNVEPVRSGLDSLAGTLRAGRREQARTAIDALRQQLTPDCALQPTIAVTDRPLPPLASFPSADDYIAQRLRAMAQDPVIQAYTLGWRCTSGLSATDFLQQYWSEQLGRPVRGEDWRALYAQARERAVQDGLANVQTAFVIQSDLPRFAPELAGELRRALYRTALREALLGQPGTLGSGGCELAQWGTSLEDSLVAFTRLTRIALQNPVALTSSAWRTCVGVVSSRWDSAFREIDQRVPPPACVAFHARVREGLNNLNQAARAVDVAVSDIAGATPAERLAFLPAARNLATVGAQAIADARQADPGRTCW
jgi:hypothetical protein